MDILYATKNKSKLIHMRDRLTDLDVRILSPDDLDLDIEVIEDGIKPSDNAKKKAEAYYQSSKLPCIGADSGLYIEGLAEDQQPGLYVRRVNQKVLTDDEMIDYYSCLAKKLGGQVQAYYLTGLAYVDENGVDAIDIKENLMIMTSEININRSHQGNPLDVLMIDPVTHKYLNELTKEEYQQSGTQFEKACRDFLKKHIC